MAESERLNTDTHDDAAFLQQPSDSADIAHDQVTDGEENPKEKSSGKKFIYATLAAGAIVLAFALVVVFYAIQQFERSEAAEEETTEIAETRVAAAVEEFTELGEIVVARETDYNFYNANLDADRRPIDTDLGREVQPPVEAEEELVFPPGGQTPSVTPATAANQGSAQLNYASLKGIDVLDAQARAQKAGYVVHQVFVCCPDAVRNNTPPPKPGLVLDLQTYTMRGDGKRYMFLHVATTEPYANARAVPSLRGQQWRAARDTLNRAGLGARFEYERSSSDAKGTVVFQAPQPGRFTPARSTVILILADN
ncbi:MAG: PASTA domain-containing protein [Coriobacteriia bacterium]|nr:PASTA domain-containing protein [Coriobacteriia bacterium]